MSPDPATPLEQPLVPRTARATCPPEPRLRLQAAGRLSELDRSDARRVGRHARGCAACREQLRGHRAQVSLGQRLLRPLRATPLRGRLLLAVLLGAATLPAPVDRSGGLAWQRCPLDGHWYARTPAADAWAIARRLAQAAGGDLAVVRSAAHNTWLTQHLADVESFGLWLGLREVGGEGRWQWVDGTPLQFSRWNSSEPSDDSHGPRDAAAMYGLWDQPHGSWNDTPAAPRPDQGTAERCTAGLAERVTDPLPGRWRQPWVRLTGGLLSGLLLLNGLALGLRRRHYHRTVDRWPRFEREGTAG
ncbi:MAG: hypothetical protein IT204_17395 [Fimbriimonadaceae bacterium]|nr:hypothetical protein [Fimbriimonadaceae bacterium]